MIAPVQKNEEFLADFHEADKVTGAFHLWWLGQSTLLIKWDGRSLLFDPYLSDSLSRARKGTDSPLTRISERVIDPLQLTGIDLVACSSLEPDRLDPETILPLRAGNPNLKLILPAGSAREAEEMLGSAAPPFLPVSAGTFVSHNSFDLHGIEAATPKIHRDQNGRSRQLGYLASFGSFAIYFSGATVWHTHLVKQVRRWPVNLAILPVSGEVKSGESGDSLNGFEAAALAKAISASIVVPCDYDLFEEVNASTEEFSSCCNRLGQRSRILKIGQRMTMGPVTDPSAGKALPSEPHRDDWNLGY